jgi:hypothetical protein
VYLIPTGSLGNIQRLIGSMEECVTHLGRQIDVL